MIKFLLTAILLLLSVVASSEEIDNMRAFPSAEKGMIRYVLKLPQEPDESVFKVELIVGKTVLVDKHNRYFFGGKIEAEVIEGWGFTLYKVSKLGPMAGTLMAVDPNEPKVSRFITISGDPYFVRYNSRLPIVVYAPEGVAIRYRIWAAGEEIIAMEKG